jgi:hypothetical protein
MAIEDLLSPLQLLPTGHAPSRVRTMLLTLRRQIELEQSRIPVFTLVGNKRITGTALVAEIDEALGEWGRLDSLIIEEKNQRQRIARRMRHFVALFVFIRQQLRGYENKPRRRLTGPQKAVAAAKLRETRRLRRTTGKRQKKALKAP